MGRLTEFGRMSSTDARRVVRAVNTRLQENAERGGERYDRLRQAVGRTMFDGAGSTREIYEQRLQQVFDRMRRGMDEQILEALFPSRENAAVLCANDYDVTMADCDALVAAAAREVAMLPYVAPDDGRALQNVLRSAGLRRESREIARKLRSGMLGVPRSLRRDERGRMVLRLLEVCPGALTTRESQIRAWHVGPTEGMARCIGGAVASRLDRARGRDMIQTVFAMNATAAEAFLGWASPEEATGAAPPAPEPQAPTLSASDILTQARDNYRSRRYAQAAQLYEQATTIDPTNARAFAGLGSSSMRLRDARRAMRAFQNAVALMPGNPNFHAMLGNARYRAGDSNGARAAFGQALAIQPGHPGATQGLAQLQSAPAPAPAAPAAAPQGPSPFEQWRTQAREHFRARRFAEAAQAYEQATRIDPAHAGALAGLGAARLALGDAPGAIRAYQGAVRIDGNQSGFWSALARAQSRTGDRDGALESLQRALAIDPNNRSAQRGMQALSSAPAAAPPPPTEALPAEAAPLPETPERDEIIRVLQPLRVDLYNCNPNFQGRVRFRLTVAGATGMVSDVAIEHETLPDAPEAACMTDVMQSVTFPPFSREMLEIAYPYQLP
ncbi:MAG: tetratricopeptide repeat protein [Myxococcota bacterium]